MAKVSNNKEVLTMLTNFEAEQEKKKMIVNFKHVLLKPALVVMKVTAFLICYLTLLGVSNNFVIM